MLQTAFGASCMNRAWVFEWHERFKEGNESVRDDEMCGRSKEVNTPEWIGQRVMVRVSMLRVCLVWRDSVRTGQHSSNWVSGISTRTMHQSITLSLSQTIWPRWALREFVTLPIVETLLPMTFGYTLAQRLSLWENWGDQRGCDEGHWHAYTRGLLWDLPEVVGMVQQVHCSQRRLLRRGLEFHVCTINKSAHTKKGLKLI